MLTRRGTGLLVGAGLLWLASQVFGTPELQIAAVAILVLLAVAVATVWSASARLRVERITRPARLSFGDHGSVTLTITNDSVLPTPRLRFQDRAPAALVDMTSTPLPPLGPGRRVELSYRLRGEQRGVAQLGPLQAEFRDPFDLIVRRRDLPGTSTVTVRPRVVTLPAGLPLGGASGSGGEGRPRPQPGGEDLAEVREYVHGDPLKAIHWASTAHRGKLMVRGEEGPQDPRATVLVDLRHDRHRGHGPTSSLEVAISAAASATAHLAARGQGVAVVDRAGPGAVPIRTLDGWLDHLAEVEASDVDLRQVVAPLTTGGLVGSCLVAVVTAPDATDLQSLVRAGRGASLRVGVLIDARTHDPRDRRPTPDVDAAAAGLRAAGWRITVVRAGDDLAERWTELLHVRRSSRHLAGTVTA
ncbi:MAG: DUF58 domain-containing protein [Intrasporangiaceae bacterium]|nr:DUF58 domain-containing protein [Intrasporangiaceae bacterium]